MNKLLIIIYILFTVILLGCDSEKSPYEINSSDKEILIYAGMSISEPVNAVVESFNNESGCMAVVIYGGSSHLKHAVEVNKTGDIFLPGVGDFNEELYKKQIITTLSNIGNYQLAFFVAKGNPLNIKGDISILKDKMIRIGVGSFLSSGVGYETEKLLKAEGLLDEVKRNAVLFASDSEKLKLSLINNNTDLVIAWGLNVKSLNASDNIEMIPIISENIRQVPLSVGLLKYTKNKSCSEKFINLVVSDKSKNIFSEFGIK